MQQSAELALTKQLLPTPKSVRLFSQCSSAAIVHAMHRTTISYCSSIVSNFSQVTYRRQEHGVLQFCDPMAMPPGFACHPQNKLKSGLETQQG